LSLGSEICGRYCYSRRGRDRQRYPSAVGAREDSGRRRRSSINRRRPESQAPAGRQESRSAGLRRHLTDYPGALHRLTGILAEHRTNIVETAYDRAYHGVNLGDTAIDITMETRGPAHIAELLTALLAAGYAHERIL